MFKLNQIGFSSEKFGEFTLEDLQFFQMLWSRMADDMQVIMNYDARRRSEPVVTSEIVRECIAIVDPESSSAFDDPSVKYELVPQELMWAMARPRIEYTNNALVLLTMFINRRLISILSEAAALAASEGLTVVKLRHYLPLCEKWPWPFNRWC